MDILETLKKYIALIGIVSTIGGDFTHGVYLTIDLMS